MQFVELCRQMGLLTTASVAIDGSKFKAVNTRDKNFTRGKVERRRAQLEESVARYLAQLDTADRQEPSEELAAKTAHLREKLVKLEGEMQRLVAMEKSMLSSPDQQISLTDPDSRSMATSGRGSGVVGYNVQVAVDTDHHLIIAHEVTNTGSDRAQLANIASRAKDALGVDKLEAVADRGYYSGEEILACDKAGIAVTLPKPMTSGLEARGRFGKQDFVYLGDEDVYRCPAGEKLSYHYTNEEDGQRLRRYWTNACRDCALKAHCTTGKERRITRWEHEHVLEAVQSRLDRNRQAMRQRRETVEHPFGTLKMRMGATHFLMKRLPKVRRDGAACPGLQSHPRHEHHGLPPASGCDASIAQARKTIANWPVLTSSNQGVLTRPRPLTSFGSRPSVQRGTGGVLLRSACRPGGIVTTAACINTIALGR